MVETFKQTALLKGFGRLIGFFLREFQLSWRAWDLDFFFFLCLPYLANCVRVGIT
ncbi:hypothetical protein PRV_01490 [Mycoplasma parvum str. Indiana]|uniref:Uncharacterized protein n=1 Tax=Mycoplasma parvum str. Indiana TaxID=1403316 RepID=U5NCK3_9MOLU|nr:hypothetical protein PRV_01490 [Mycoplasma parvum str. Indiana]